MKKQFCVCLIFLTLLGVSPRVLALTLEEAVSFAASHNTTVLAAEQKVQKSMAQIKQATAIILPIFKVDMAGARMDSFQTKLAGLSPYTAYSVKLGVQQLLFNNQILPVLSVADKALQATKDDLRVAQIGVKYDVISAYMACLKTDQFLQLAMGNKTLLLSHLDQVNALVATGIATKTDQLSVKVALSDAETRILEAQKGRKLAMMQLNLTLGKPILETYSLVTPNIKLSQDLSSVDQVVLMALANRPDLASLDKMKDMIKANSDIELAKVFPQFYFSANYGWVSTSLESLFSQKTEDWMATIAASWTLFDGFLTEGKVAENQSEVIKLEQSQAFLKQAIQLEVQEALLSLAVAKKTWAQSKATESLALENVNLIWEKYRQGLATNRDVLDADYALFQARSGIISAAFDQQLAIAKLEKVGAF